MNPEFAPAEVDIEHIPDGGLILRSPMELEPYAANLCSYLVGWAEQAADRTFIAERAATGEWRHLSYDDALNSVRALAQGLMDHDVSVDRPLMILSENSIDNGLLQLAAMFVGLPVAPVSPAYSLMSYDFGKLKHVFDLLRPKVVFASDGELFRKALSGLNLQDVTVVVTGHVPDGIDAIPIGELLATEPAPAVDEAFSHVGPDTVAKILFTSGSTGMPKGVINSHRMMCSNQQAMAQVWPFITRRPPVLVDWLPWNHTFGGNHNFNMILRNGGTLYIDSGKPAPGLFEATIENLREIAPTVYFNVPRGFQMLAPFLEKDAGLRDQFFSNLDTIFYAAAALPQDLWERIENLSIAAIGKKVAMTSAWGLTESAPLATSIHFPATGAGVIGLPVPGTELKMLPSEGKMELRLRGPNMTPGYFRRDDLTAAAYDEDGFYRTGDAGKFVDPDDPAKGILFDGRVAEDFKLLTGSWVNTGMVRVAAISACAEVIQDAVVTGHDRDEIGLLIIPNVAGMAKIAGLSTEAPLPELLGNATARQTLCDSLAAHNSQNPATSTRIARLLFLDEPLSIDAGEITDKGYVNQRAVLERRHALVEQLYSDDAAVILIN
ncbi:MAG: feruloyl-CoA synthase [Gammaproteobacteria bacterium]|nr:feruloyl-CoA synthase [Gammaproteobacteria bacterium]MDH3749484.1 feruloyl-CoA synthase [Gammaproteobacteria bacterium]MDH3804962.1 feruloyl-CoA synthase [Gammaproteobacteria bacterium]